MIPLSGIPLSGIPLSGSPLPGKPLSALVDWAEAELGSVRKWINHSWDHGTSQVFEAHLENGERAFLKVHGKNGKLEQEQHAYEAWCPAVGGTPRLIAARLSTPSALLLSASPGLPLLGLASEPPVEQDAYEQAGRWLARLHALQVTDSDPVPIDRALTLRARSWATRAEGHVESSACGRVIELASRTWPARSPVPGRSACHRDYTARNWLWADGQLTVIDFEHSRLDWHLVDHERVRSSIPDGRDDLLRAFEHGYGRALTAAELRQLRALTAVSALTRVAWAVEHRDEAFERSGRRQLQRALAE